MLFGFFLSGFLFENLFFFCFRLRAFARIGMRGREGAREGGSEAVDMGGLATGVEFTLMKLSRKRGGGGTNYVSLYTGSFG